MGFPLSNHDGYMRNFLWRVQRDDQGSPDNVGPTGHGVLNNFVPSNLCGYMYGGFLNSHSNFFLHMMVSHYLTNDDTCYHSSNGFSPRVFSPFIII